MRQDPGEPQLGQWFHWRFTVAQHYVFAILLFRKTGLTLKNLEPVNFRTYLQAVQDEFVKEGYQIGIKLNDKKTVNAAFIRFNNLLYEFGLSVHHDEVLAVKLRSIPIRHREQG
jgi:hypothetical protein